MRKLTLLLILFSFAFINLNAQDRTISRTDRTTYVPFTKNVYVDVYTGVTADSITSNQDSLYLNYTVTRPYAINYILKVEVDTAAGADTATLALFGKVMSSDSWTQIATATYTGTADTAITYNSAGTEVNYNYLQYRIVRTGTGGNLSLRKSTIIIKEPY